LNVIKADIHHHFIVEKALVRLFDFPQWSFQLLLISSQA
jgi:hypothetical protein